MTPTPAPLPPSTPTTIHVRMADVQASIVYRLHQAAVGARGPEGFAYLALGAAVAVVLLALAYPKLARVSAGASIIALLLGEWGLLARQRAQIRHWRDSGVLHSAWLAGEPEEVTMVAASGGYRVLCPRTLLAQLAMNPISFLVASNAGSPMGAVFVALYGFILIAAGAGLVLSSRQSMPVASISARALCYLTAPWSDPTLLARAAISAAAAAFALLLVAVPRLHVVQVAASAALLALALLPVWGILKVKATTREMHDRTPMQTRWRRFLGIEEPAADASPATKP